LMTRPLCFVLMPYHPAVESDGQRIDFEAVYDRLIVPAVESAGMAPVRAREDPRGGIFQKNMFERLVVCEFAIADLSTGNANVYYEGSATDFVRIAQFSSSGRVGACR
jgi:hypothetical protein